MDALFRAIPAGVGKGGPYRFAAKELRRLMGEGVAYLQGRGLATAGDIQHTEAQGCLRGAEADDVSPRALDRGADQCGTLGAGNHFLEVQVVEEICDEAAARAMGLCKDQVCVMIHSGSRGLGYQVCDDALAAFRKVPAKYGIELPDRQLACAPVHSDEGQKYLGAMRAAANFAWGNRQLLMWQARETFAEVFEQPWESLRMNLVYDVAHNIAKLEEHTVDGQAKKLCVHRKGATRAFPAGHAGIARSVSRHRPAGDHPRRHGPGELGAGRSAGQHGAVVRHDLSRGRPGHEPHGRRAARPRPADRSRIGRPRRDRPLPELEGTGRRAAGGV